MKLTLTEILDATQGIKLSSDKSAILTSLCSDTRIIREGDGYIALCGENFDGNDFVFNAAENGATFIILSDKKKGKELVDKYPLLSVIFVEDGLIALQNIANCWRKKIKGTVVFITGSNGKTTTKEMVAAVLRRKKRVSVTPKNFNNLIGLPQTLLNVSEEDEVIVLEAGMNQQGEIQRLAEIALPDIGIVLNIASAHIGHFGSIDAICDAKWELIDAMGENGKILVNGNDEILAKKSRNNARINLYGSGYEDIEVRNVYVSKKGTTFEVVEQGESVFFTLNMIGKHFVSAVMATLAIAKELGFTTQEVADALKTFEGVKNRLSVKQTDDWEIINDAYNANPESMKAGIQAIHDIRNGIPTWYVLGDMGELGNLSATYHRGIGHFIAENIDKDIRKPSFLLVGNMGKIIGEPLEEKFGVTLPLRYCADYKKAVEILKKEQSGNTRVYLKASNSMKLYKVEEGLLN